MYDLHNQANLHIKHGNYGKSSKIYQECQLFQEKHEYALLSRHMLYIKNKNIRYTVKIKFTCNFE